MTKDLLLKKLGRHIAALREEKSISQAELARSSDKDPQSLNRLEKGRINPSIFYLYEIAKELGVSLKDLVDIEE
jgi:putative transcriptional regulator